MNAAEGIPTKYQSPVDPAESEVTQWLNPRKRNDPRRMSGVISFVGESAMISCPRVFRSTDPAAPDVPGGVLGWPGKDKKQGRKNPTQHRYHITLPVSSQRLFVLPGRKSVPCTKTANCIWGTFHLEKLEFPCYLIGTKRRYKNSKSSGGLPKANGKYGNQSDFKSK